MDDSQGRLPGRGGPASGPAGWNVENGAWQWCELSLLCACEGDSEHKGQWAEVGGVGFLGSLHHVSLGMVKEPVTRGNW